MQSWQNSGVRRVQMAMEPINQTRNEEISGNLSVIMQEKERMR